MIEKSEKVEKLHKIRTCLAKALLELPETISNQETKPVPSGFLIGTRDEFEEFLEHDEFELAWETLFSMANRTDGSPSFWSLLATSADLMGLTDKHRAVLKKVCADGRNPDGTTK